ncbi:MAG: hypothetical protein NZ703_09175, partial [Gemmataceae bacterium]|nr:hypothetical protein [Gemmataceae bacterium]
RSSDLTVKITGKIQFMGNEQPIPPQEQKIDLTQPYDPTRFSGPLPMGAQVQVDKGKEGKEKVSLAGKSYNCTWTEYKVNTKAAGVAFEANVKVWMSPEVPLGMVKMSMTSNQGPQKMQMTMELKETGQNK